MLLEMNNFRMEIKEKICDRNMHVNTYTISILIKPQNKFDVHK